MNNERHDTFYLDYGRIECIYSAEFGVFFIAFAKDLHTILKGQRFRYFLYTRTSALC